jgi:hypothetical protein
MSGLESIIDIYRILLRPIPPFTWFGVPLSTLDLGATVRLCLVMRQIRELNLSTHIKQQQVTSSAGSGAGPDKKNGIEERSMVRDLAATLVVVYGGEAVIGAFDYFLCYTAHPNGLLNLRVYYSSITKSNTLIHAFRSGPFTLCGNTVCSRTLTTHFTAHIQLPS